MTGMTGMICLHVTNWDRLYEVDDHDNIWDGKKPRKRNLRYIRLWVNGPKGNGMEYRHAQLVTRRLYGHDAWCVAWGIFCKLLEIAAKQPRHLRGYIVLSQTQPLTIEELAYFTLFTPRQIELGIKILLEPEINWLEEVELRISHGNSPKLRETPGQKESLI